MTYGAAVSAFARQPSEVKCDRCNVRIKLRNLDQDWLCDKCRPIALEELVIFDRSRGIGHIPANLVKRYG